MGGCPCLISRAWVISYRGRPSGRAGAWRLALSAAALAVLCAAALRRQSIAEFASTQAEWLYCSHGIVGGTVVDDERATNPPASEANGLDLVRTGDGVCVFRAPPAAWIELVRRSSGFDYLRDMPAAMLYLGEMRSPSGHRRLVGLSRPVRGRGAGGLYDSVLCFVVRRDGVLSRPACAGGGTAPQNVKYVVTSECADQMRLYAGSPVVGHQDHIEIPYDMDNSRGTIDAWLRDDDTLRVAVRDGPAFSPK